MDAADPALYLNAMRVLLALSIAILGALACGRVEESQDDEDAGAGTGASAGTSAVGGASDKPSTGGADSESGGAESNATGGADSESGGADSESGGAESNATGGRDTKTIDKQWQELIAPRTAPHEVYVAGDCGSERRVSDAYQVLPTPECAVAPDYVTTRKRNCSVRAYCETSADCTLGDNPVCEGIPDPSKSCFYPLPAPTQCTSDDECTALPDGTCSPVSISDDFHCYPSGECLTHRCQYPLGSCESDADCADAPGGECIQPIRYTACRYDACTADKDCAEGSRCGCGTCVPAECHSNGDCPDDEACSASVSICGATLGYYCTTPDDECEPGDESHCEYEGGAWKPMNYTCR